VNETGFTLIFLRNINQNLLLWQTNCFIHILLLSTFHRIWTSIIPLCTLQRNCNNKYYSTFTW